MGVAWQASVAMANCWCGPIRTGWLKKKKKRMRRASEEVIHFLEEAGFLGAFLVALGFLGLLGRDAFFSALGFFAAAFLGFFAPAAGARLGFAVAVVLLARGFLVPEGFFLPAAAAAAAFFFFSPADGDCAEAEEDSLNEPLAPLPLVCTSAPDATADLRYLRIKGDSFSTSTL